MKPAEAYFGMRGYVLAGLGCALISARLRSTTPLRPLALIPVALGFGLRLWAARHIGPHSNGVSFAPYGRETTSGANSLATGGPYAFTRHPLYVANFLVASGTVLFANVGKGHRWYMHLLIPVVAVHHILLALLEEKHLQKALGDEYLRYRQATPTLPRFLRSGKTKVRETAPLSWGDSLARQRGNLAKASAVIALVATARWGR